MVVALEVQHLGRQDAPARECRRHVRRNRSEVFADDERAMTHALERDDAEQVVGRVAHVGAVSAGEAVGDPEQTEETEHVVDA